MKLTYAAIFVAVIIGIFYFVPQSKPTPNDANISEATDTKISENTTKETTTMPTDPTKFEKISATSAIIKTPKGEITLELYPNDAPKTVTNFATLAKNGYYDDLTFHRVEPNFVIQGGDPKGNGTGGTSIYGAKFEDELNPESASYKIGYKEGVLAMANSGPDTNGSQFFIMLADNPNLPKNYTIFGLVTDGIEVVKKIEKGNVINTIEIK